jgi:succinate-semialdehyde dehydrogenase / glutarate-semialdehyde dehydrogenase
MLYGGSEDARLDAVLSGRGTAATETGGGMAIASINPATGEVLAEFDALDEAQLEERLARSAAAFVRLRSVGIDERSRWMARAGDLLEAREEALGRLITLEMGKPIRASVAEVRKCAVACRYYARTGARHLADETIETDAHESWVRYEPLGPVLAVMPWNFPFWQVFRFAAPSLVAGNVALLKHASNVPQCALAIEEVLRDAGFGADEFQTLLVGSDRVAEILADPRVRAATLTGSGPAGGAVASEAGKRIKKTVLELGGSDPFIVMPSADLPAAVETAVAARTVNTGQSCIAAKRFIVHEAIYDEFERAFVQRMAGLRMGDPLDPETELGPLATPSIREEVHAQVDETVEAGARLLLGGRLPEGRGNFYPATVLTDIQAGSPAASDEIFGPVAALFRAGGVQDALRLANDTKFGLGSAVWTRDARERATFIEGLEAGQVFVNGMVASDPRLPFGGVKESGYGRELGELGIREFVNVKTVWVGSAETHARSGTE